MTNNGGPSAGDEHDPPIEEAVVPALPSPDAVVDEIASDRALEYQHLRALSYPSDAIVRRVFALWSHIPAERRREVLAKLQQLADEDATLDVHRIHLSALRDPDAATRILAVRGLWEQERPDYMRLLTKQLRDDPEPSARAEIADSLGKWVLSLEFGLMTEDDAEELTSQLREAIEDIEEQDEVRARALESLGAWSDESTAELISEMYELGNHRLRVAALRAMGRNASDSWLQILVYQFDDEDPEIRAVAATAVGQLLSDEGVAPLAMLLQDPDEDVQVAAVRALGEIANEESERILTRMLSEDDSSHLRAAVRNALAEVQLLALPLVDDEGRPPEFGAEFGARVGRDDDEDDEDEEE